MTGDLLQAAFELAEVLKKRQDRIVFAESCTAGMLSASLATVPGISDYLCGSAVTYREATKQHWLDISEQLLAERTAVSREVTESMATSVLKSTPEATWSMAITGHLGPDAPEDLDGRVFVAAAKRESSEVVIVASEGILLTSVARAERQDEAALVALRLFCECLANVE